MGILLGRRVPVHARDPRARKETKRLAFDLLCPDPEIMNVVFLTGGANFLRGRAKMADVAKKGGLVIVVRKTDPAVFASHHVIGSSK